ncbi:MAG TPA: hypothetical protein VK611_19465 [Acidimicrobiales bacterium]|nr:hypothetical protein [Acidimicrobiales bacterium]
MSWDVFIMRFPTDLSDARDIPSDWEPPRIGTNAEIRRTFLRLLPDLVVDHDGHARYEGPGFILNVDLSGPDDEVSEAVTLHFYGGGPGAAGVAVEITEALAARAISTGGGGFLERATAMDDWRWWQRYRDHALGASGPPGPASEHAGED